MHNQIKRINQKKERGKFTKVVYEVSSGLRRVTERERERTQQEWLGVIQGQVTKDSGANGDGS